MFIGSELNFLALHFHHALLDIDLHAAEAHDRTLRRDRDRAAQRGTNSRQQLAYSEWFRDVIIGAEIESGNLIVFLAARGEDHDRHLTPFADPADHLKPSRSGRPRSRRIKSGRLALTSISPSAAVTDSW